MKRVIVIIMLMAILCSCADQASNNKSNNQNDALNSETIAANTTQLESLNTGDYYEFISKIQSKQDLQYSTSDMISINFNNEKADAVVIDGCLWLLSDDSNIHDAYPWYSCSSKGVITDYIISNLDYIKQNYNVTSLAVVIGLSADKIPDDGFAKYPVNRADTVNGKTVCEWIEEPDFFESEYNKNALYKYIKNIEDVYVTGLKTEKTEKLYETDTRFVYRLIIDINSIDDIVNIGTDEIPCESPYYIRIASVTSK